MPDERESSDYALEPPDNESNTKHPPPLAPGPIGLVAAPVIDLSCTDAPCLNCGYNLRGLTREGVCPECGTPIMRSLQGNLLIFSSREYVAMLHRGVLLILISVVLSVLAALGVIVATIYAGILRGGGAGLGWIMLSTGLVFAIALVSLAGWWLFSAPDPAIMGSDKGDVPRKVVRVTVIIMAAATLFTMLVSFAATSPEMEMLDLGVQIISGIASVSQFFASMMYVRWLGPRLSDPSITVTAGQYMWLLPLIYIFGLCIIIGPLIAAVMYYFLLNRVRVHLRYIRQQQQKEMLGGAALA